jgi:hypothetical protein
MRRSAWSDMGGKRPFSSVMQRALDDAKANGGRLYRWPGGYWLSRLKAFGEASPAAKTYHTTGTINALIDRRLLIDTGSRDERGQPWIVEVIAK